jgi:two-component system, NarL family, sensor histidine kinase YdfH
MLNFLTPSVFLSPSRRIGLSDNLYLYFRTVSAWTMESAPKLVYNSIMPEQPAPNTLAGVERDPRLFTWFLTMVMAIMYTVSLLEKPALRLPVPLVIYTILFIVHTLLHWQIEKIFEKPKLLFAYVLVQGGLGFAICWMAAHEAVTFAIYMALFGEAIGMFGLTRRGLLATIYYFTLAFISIQQIITTFPPVLMAVTALPVLVFVVIYVVLYSRQAKAREQAQELAAQLEIANRQLTEYAAQVEDLTIAAERQRMARELHDTLSQGLAGLILQLEAADAQLGRQNPEKARQIIAQAMQKARESLADARRAISNLRETHLGEFGDSLRREIDRFEAATGIPCALHADQTPPLPDSVKETVLRTVSESLTNIARHARASEAAVALSLSNIEAQTLMLKIKDNGTGFDPQNIPSGHYGLLGIRERIRLTGGTFTLDTAPQTGTILTVHIPITQSPNHEITQ